MISSFRIESAVGTHAGRVRTNNEDAYADCPATQLWAVADGMGGHEFGEFASTSIVATLRMLQVPDDFETACIDIADAIHRSNGDVFAEANARDVQMGSTVVALHLNGGKFGVFWVGDSRAYLMREGQLYQLSRDHTQVQELVDRGLLTPEAAHDHPMAHVLARAVGVQQEVEVDVVYDEALSGDIFLLCSDGLTGQVSDAEIAEALVTTSHQEALQRLITLTLERGAPDNVTIAIVGVNDSTMLTLTSLGSMPS